MLSTSTTPRVTDILRPFTTYDQVPKLILERAAAKGTSVHALCAGIAKGNWIPDSMIDEELVGFVKSFKQWQDAQVQEFVIIEERFIDCELRFTGQVDYVVKGNDDKLYLVDLKTGSKPQRTHPVQMAAYRELLKQKGIVVEGVMLVYLSRDGEFPNINYIEELDEELDVFLSAVTCYKFFNRRKAYARKI